jgi:hypothetical protein
MENLGKRPLLLTHALTFFNLRHPSRKQNEGKLNDLETLDDLASRDETSPPNNMTSSKLGYDGIQVKSLVSSQQSQSMDMQKDKDQVTQYSVLGQPIMTNSLT